jgi:hypothetical protein
MDQTSLLFQKINIPFNQTYIFQSCGQVQHWICWEGCLLIRDPNYIDCSITKLTATPLVAKRATGVAVVLLNIFTEQGPPIILQADNGGEFSGSATDHVGRRMQLDYEFIDAVISKIKQFWTECQLVWGSPRHSESNGGVEQVNQTIQKKLGAWMKENKNTQWSIGCKIAQWRYNT